MDKSIPAEDGPAESQPFVNGAAKEYIRIGDLAREHDVTLRALRFYEDKGLLQPVREGHTRLYTRRDRARLKLILLGRKLGFTLRDVKHIIELYDPQTGNARQIRLVLEKSERQLSRLQKQRVVLDEAIDELAALIAKMRGLSAENPKAAVSR